MRRFALISAVVWMLFDGAAGFIAVAVVSTHTLRQPQPHSFGCCCWMASPDVTEFLQLVAASPVGDLSSAEVALLRTVMDDYAKDNDNDEDAPIVVEDLLFRLVEEWKIAKSLRDENKEEAWRPQAEDFALAIQTWERSSHPEEQQVHVLSLLSDARELYLEHGLESVRPTPSTIASVLKSLLSSASRDVTMERRASQVFDSLSSDFAMTPDPELYTLMITILAKSRQSGAARRAERLLKEAVQTHPAKIPVEAFNVVVTAYAKSRREKDNSVQRAQDLIVYMEQVEQAGGNLGICRPNVHTFTSLIDAYASQTEWESVCEADRLLNRLLEQYLEEEDQTLEPNIATWTIVMSAWARLSRKNRNGAAKRAGRLLERMDALYEQGRISFQPDAITRVSCLNAYAYEKNGDGAGAAEDILGEMNQLYLDGDDSMRPSGRSVKLVVDAWIKAGDLECAEDLLKRYEDLVSTEPQRNRSDSAHGKNYQSSEPVDFVKDIYGSLVVGAAQAGETLKAKQYLDTMIAKDMVPDSLFFERIIDANTRINDANSLRNSLQVFEMLEKTRVEKGVEPTERAYTSFIRAMTKGHTPGLHQKANVVLQKMKNLHQQGYRSMRPTVFAYNAVLNACAESVHVPGVQREDAFKTAIATFTELRDSSSDKPDQVTYGNMLRCANLLSDGEKKDKFVTATFQLCCKQGYVNNFVVRDLQLAASEDLWRTLLGQPRGDDVLVEQLPSQWTSMVQGKVGRKTRW